LIEALELRGGPDNVPLVQSAIVKVETLRKGKIKLQREGVRLKIRFPN
jgi:hypothetical protein